MTTESLTLVPRETRNNNNEKRGKRHVDQKIHRQKKLAFKAKRNYIIDDVNENYENCY